MKVLDLCCANRHRFEGWFGSEADFQSQTARRLVTCPVCSDAAVVRLPSAPRLNRSRQEAEATAGKAPAVPAAHPDTELQTRWLQEMRRIVHESEDVGERFADEARRIHHGQAEARGIRGQASKDEAEALREEGIAVMSVVLPESLKGPVH